MKKEIDLSLLTQKITILPDWEDVKAANKELWKAHDEACHTLGSIKGIGSGAMGLTPDHIKCTTQYKDARKAVDIAFNTLRKHNQFINKYFAKQRRIEREIERQKRTMKYVKPE